MLVDSATMKAMKIPRLERVSVCAKACRSQPAAPGSNGFSFLHPHPHQHLHNAAAFKARTKARSKFRDKRVDVGEF